MEISITKNLNIHGLFGLKTYGIKTVKTTICTGEKIMEQERSVFKYCQKVSTGYFLNISAI